VANRVPGIRATLAWHVDSARAGRAHNDSNVLALGQRFVPETDLYAILDAWLQTPFEGGRHQRRIELIDQMQPTGPARSS
jgi:ribose 5-phosphate isomerase B